MEGKIMKKFNLILVLFLIIFAAKNIKCEEFVDLSYLINIALKENPKIKAAKLKLQSSLEVPKQVKTLPDPVLMVGLKNVGGNFSLGKEEMSMLDFGITQPIPYPKKLKLLEKISEKEAEAVSEELKAVVFEVISELKIEYFDYYYLEKSIGLLEKTKNLLEEIEKIAKTKYEVGLGNQQDIWKAKLEISHLEERVEVLKQMEESSLAKIRALLNLEQNFPLGKPSDFDLTEFNLDLNSIYEVAKNSPYLKIFEKQKEKSSLDLSLSKLSYYPDFSLTIGYGNRGSLDGVWSLYFGVQIPIYYKSKQDRYVSQMDAALSSKEMEFENKKREIEGEAKRIYIEIETTKKLIDLYKNSIIPQAKNTLNTSMYEYSVGKVDFLTLITNAVEALDYEIEYFGKIANYQKAISRLEGLLGSYFGKEEIKW